MRNSKRIITLLILIIFVLSSVCEVFALAEEPSKATLPQEAAASEPVTPEDPSVPEEPTVPEEPSEEVTIPVPEAPVLTAKPIPTGIRLFWTQVENAEGYYVFRRTSPEEDWVRFYLTTKATTLAVTNKKVENGVHYEYTIQAYNEGGTSDYAESVSSYWLQPPSLTIVSREGTSYTIGWEENLFASGYEIRYCQNRFFNNAGRINVEGGDVVTTTFDTNFATANYYFKIRAYTVLEDGAIIYSPWGYSDNQLTNSTAKIQLLKYNNKKLELRTLGKGVVGKYDTLQGGCYADGYYYYVLYNRKVEKCRIIKMDLTTGKRVKKSKVLPIAHGNDLTYNTKTGQLIAVHNTIDGRVISFIDPVTLTVTGTKTIELPDTLPGLTANRRANYEGIGALAYNAERDQYVARIRNIADYLILDGELNPIEYIRPTQKDSQTYQGMDAIGDYFLVGQSYESGNPYNIFTLYDWDGNYIAKITVKKGYELENIFHIGSTFYAGFYTSGYETYYKTKYKIKKVKKKNGKYKKKKVKVKVKKKRLYRNNYLYKLSNI